jgi:hypothetical protein
MNQATKGQGRETGIRRETQKRQQGSQITIFVITARRVSLFQPYQGFI